MEKEYDLEERTTQFAREVRVFIRRLPKTLLILEDIKQLMRSSGSVAANYIEANESLSRKDYYNRVKICRKEAKESGLWLDLIESNSPDLDLIKEKLRREAIELTKIFGSIVSKRKND